MRRLPTMIMLVTLLVPGAAGYGHPDAGLACEQIKQKIRYIQSKMRSGYTRAQGEKMQADLRKLRALRQKACR